MVMTSFPDSLSGSAPDIFAPRTRVLPLSPAHTPTPSDEQWVTEADPVGERRISPDGREALRDAARMVVVRSLVRQPLAGIGPMTEIAPGLSLGRAMAVLGALEPRAEGRAGSGRGSARRQRLAHGPGGPDVADLLGSTLTASGGELAVPSPLVPGRARIWCLEDLSRAFASAGPEGWAAAAETALRAQGLTLDPVAARLKPPALPIACLPATGVGPAAWLALAAEAAEFAPLLTAALPGEACAEAVARVVALGYRVTVLKAALDVHPRLGTVRMPEARPLPQALWPGDRLTPPPSVATALDRMAADGALAEMAACRLRHAAAFEALRLGEALAGEALSLALDAGRREGALGFDDFDGQPRLVRAASAWRDEGEAVTAIEVIGKQARE